ncbi:MAG: class I SAM-dependent methyltransferase [Anaerolineae bacterium]|jgi:ubiquinone/menaquinone biosynthesis C-methylase UbiE
MENVVLRTNAIPVYGFLSLITANRGEGTAPTGRRILDCGAGGPVPPLALFHQHGFEGWGIDTSQEQLDRASQFCQEHDIDLHLRKGDMRRIPFEDESFDYVYEHYSMCHLSKLDTALAVGEMDRVLKRGGLCFLGVISADTWPKSLFGKETAPGEYQGEEGGEDAVVHSMFTDQEADELVSGWEVVSKKKHLRYLWETAEEVSLEAWMDLYDEAKDSCSREDWQAAYESRRNAFRYAHLYYCLRKA